MEVYGASFTNTAQKLMAVPHPHLMFLESVSYLSQPRMQKKKKYSSQPVFNLQIKGEKRMAK